MGMTYSTKGLVALVVATLGIALPAMTALAVERGPKMEPEPAKVGSLSMEMYRRGARISNGGQAVLGARSERFECCDGDADQPAFKDGEYVEVCITPDRDGFMSIWNDDLTVNPERVYPNPWSHREPVPPAAEVRAGEEICVGGDQEWRLKITTPIGVHVVRAVVTDDLPSHPTNEDNIDFSKASRAGGRGDIPGSNAEMPYKVEAKR